MKMTIEDCVSSLLLCGAGRSDADGCDTQDACEAALLMDPRHCAGLELTEAIPMLVNGMKRAVHPCSADLQQHLSPAILRCCFAKTTMKNSICHQCLCPGYCCGYHEDSNRRLVCDDYLQAMKCSTMRNSIPPQGHHRAGCCCCSEDSQRPLICGEPRGSWLIRSTVKEWALSTGVIGGYRFSRHRVHGGEMVSGFVVCVPCCDCCGGWMVLKNMRSEYLHCLYFRFGGLKI